MRRESQRDPEFHPEAPNALGAYYTDVQAADFLVAWAVRSPNDRILDPSFGGGVFLRSASRRLRSRRGSPGKNVCGVEIDPGAPVHLRKAHGRIRRRIGENLKLSIGYVTGANAFFHVNDETVRAYDIQPELLQAGGSKRGK
jgi:hypothetical protein